MEADRFPVRVREHDGTYLGAIFGDRETLMNECEHAFDSCRWRHDDGVRLCHKCGAVVERRADLIAAALASHDARVTA